MLIVDMPMPKSCNECETRCASALYGRICGMTRKNVMPFLDKPNRPNWCPIKGELVTCGECKHWDQDLKYTDENGRRVCRKDGKWRGDDFYCADGKRKDGAE